MLGHLGSLGSEVDYRRVYEKASESEPGTFAILTSKILIIEGLLLSQINTDYLWNI